MARPPPTYTVCLLSYLNEDINALISIYVNVNVSLLFAPRLGIMYANLATTPRNICRLLIRSFSYKVSLISVIKIISKILLRLKRFKFINEKAVELFNELSLIYIISPRSFFIKVNNFKAIL